MSKRTWVTADPHFGHALMARLRPFEDHDEALIERWNSVVGEFDRVYILGDLSMNRKAITTVGRCHGKKVLVKGNHDMFKLKDYTPYFEDIRAYVVKPKHQIVMSHMPIHPQCMGSRYKLNVHGHLHEETIRIDGHTQKDDPTYEDLCETIADRRYKCVSMEQTDYRPVNLEEIINA